MAEWLVEHIAWLLGFVTLGSVATVARLLLVLRREHRESHKARREERESLAPHIEEFWRATDALYHDFGVRCSNPERGPGAPTILLDELLAAQRAVLARTTNSEVSTAVEVYAREMRGIAGGRMDGEGRLQYPNADEWSRFFEAQKQLREYTLRPK